MNIVNSLQRLDVVFGVTQTQDKMNIWASEVMSVCKDEEVLAKSIEQIIRTSERKPSIATVINTYKEFKRGKSGYETQGDIHHVLDMKSVNKQLGYSEQKYFCDCSRVHVWGADVDRFFASKRFESQGEAQTQENF